jgi:hypothetical protein
LAKHYSGRQIQLLAVLYGKEVELLTSVQYLGYLPPAVVGISQVQTTFHLKLAAKLIRDSQNPNGNFWPP